MGVTSSWFAARQHVYQCDQGYIGCSVVMVDTDSKFELNVRYPTSMATCQTYYMF